MLVPYIECESAPREMRGFLLPSVGNALIHNKVFRCRHCLGGHYSFLQAQKLPLMRCIGSRVYANCFIHASRSVLNNSSSHQLGMSQKPWCIKGWCAPQNCSVLEVTIQTKQNKTGKLICSWTSSTSYPPTLGTISDPSTAFGLPCWIKLTLPVIFSKYYCCNCIWILQLGTKCNVFLGFQPLWDWNEKASAPSDGQASRAQTHVCILYSLTHTCCTLLYRSTSKRKKLLHCIRVKFSNSKWSVLKVCLPVPVYFQSCLYCGGAF